MVWIKNQIVFPLLSDSASQFTLHVSNCGYLITRSNCVFFFFIQWFRFMHEGLFLDYFLRTGTFFDAVSSWAFWNCSSEMTISPYGFTLRLFSLEAGVREQVRSTLESKYLSHILKFWFVWRDWWRQITIASSRPRVL